MAILTLTRPRQFADMLRGYRIIVDGREEAVIRPGQTVEIELKPGIHIVRAAIDWAGSQSIEIELRPDVDHHLEVGSNIANWRLLFAALYITIWRNDYLYLREI